MKIYIPTRERGKRQITSGVLSEAFRNHTIVETNGDNIGQGKYHNVISIAPMGIRATRQYILDDAFRMKHGKIMVMDDDLTFRRRKPDGSFTKATTNDVRDLLAQVEEHLNQYAHVSMCDEFMCQHQPRGIKTHGRYNSFVAFNLTMFPTPRPSYRIEINEDHDMNLQLQAAGLPPAIMCEWTRSTKPYAAGGCNTWRTAEVELRGHLELAMLWPDLVKVMPVKNGMSGHAIRVKWKNALKGGQT